MGRNVDGYTLNLEIGWNKGRKWYQFRTANGPGTIWCDFPWYFGFRFHMKCSKLRFPKDHQTRSNWPNCQFQQLHFLQVHFVKVTKMTLWRFNVPSFASKYIIFKPCESNFYPQKKIQKTTQQDPGNMSKKNWTAFCWFLNFVDSIRCHRFFFCVSLCWVWPLPSSSDHQDDHIFSRESQPKPLFDTVTGRGAIPNLYGIYDCFSPAKKQPGRIWSTRASWRVGNQTGWRMICFAPEKKTHKTTIYGIDLL